MLLDDAFSSIHEDESVNAFSTLTVVLVINGTILTDFVADVVLTQVLSVWAWEWGFDLKANSVSEGVGWDAGQANSVSVKGFTKITDSGAFSVIVWNVSGLTDNFNTFVFFGAPFVGPNAFCAFSSDFLEELAERISVDTISGGIEVLFVSTG